MLVDSHCHLEAAQFHADREEVINRCEGAGMYCVLAGDSLAASKASLALAQHHRILFTAVGIHPHHAVDDAWDEQAFLSFLASPKVVAIGECGLDYHALPHDDTSARQRQWRLFQRQLEFAQSNAKPVVVHCRDAYEDVLAMLKDFPKLPVMVHTFSAGPDIAEKFLFIGAHLSFSGVITFAKTDDIRESARITPLDRMLVETDAPYLAPTPHRGSRNEPIWVREVVKTIADVKALSVEDVQEATGKNATHFFGLS